MSHTAGHGPFAREHPRAWIGRAPEELPQGWIDDMVRRRLEEVNRQMIRLETASKKETDDTSDARTRELNARTLAKLGRELKDALSMEDDRAVKRAARNTQGEYDAVAALERRLDQLLERERAAHGLVESGAERSQEAR
jgi:hypothetical protein